MRVATALSTIEDGQVVELSQALVAEQLELLDDQGGDVDLVPAGGKQIVPEQGHGLLEGVGIRLPPPSAKGPEVSQNIGPKH